MFDKIVSGGIALALSCTFGCAAIEPSGYLPGYEHLTQGRHVERFWADQPLNPQAVARLTVEEIDTSQIFDHPKVTREDAATWLKDAAVSAIAKQQGWEVCASPESSTGRLFLAITYLTPGSAGGRIFAGELGLGHAFVQVEGKLVETGSGKVVAAFADRRRDSGSIGLEDTFGDSGPRLVRQMLERTASDAVKEIAAELK